MGSRPKTPTPNDYAYIAGFLDGDGSLMLQFKKRKDTKKGVRFMATICLYQDTKHSQPLKWMRDIFNIGYISRRSDGISELRINGFKQVALILRKLIPFLKFKKVQAQALLEACQLLQNPDLSKSDLRKVVSLMYLIKEHNYKSHHKTLKQEELLELLGLTP